MNMAELVVCEIEPGDKSQLGLKCNLCSVDGVSVCVDCMDCLCNNCLEIHSNNAVLKAHRIVSKDNLPMNFTSQTLHEIKYMIFCSTHEVLFEYYCEDHAEFICQVCTRKSHQCCKRILKIQNVQSSPQSVLHEIQELRNGFKDVMEQRQKFKEIESAETMNRIRFETTIIAKIQAFTDQRKSGKERGDHEDETEAVDLLCDDLRRVVRLQDRHEELLRSVLHLNHSEITTVVSRRVELSLENVSLKKSIESGMGLIGSVKKISDRLEILGAVTDELVSPCDDEGKRFNRIKQLMREKTCKDTEVQTELYRDTNVGQLPQVCATGPFNESSDENTKQHVALREAHTYKDADVQTEGEDDTSSTIRQGPCTAEFLTIFADVYTEPDDVTGPLDVQAARTYMDAEVQTEDEGDTCKSIGLGSCTTEHLTASADLDTELDYDVSGLCSSQQSNSVGVGRGSTYPSSLDCGCQTTGSTQQRDTTIPLSESSLAFSGSYNVCDDGEEYCDISGICVLRSGLIALIDCHNDSLRVYDECFQFRTFFELDRNPIDICVVNHDSDRVAITFASKRVGTYDISIDTICFVRGFHLSLYCRGICSVSRDTIAVLVSDVEPSDESGHFPYTNSNEDNIKIQIRDVSNGRIISSIDTFETEVRNPSHILQDDQDNIIIGEQNQVSAFDIDGERLWFYKTYKGSKLDDVIGMDMDPEGNIYVCSYGSNSIHQVSSLNYRNNRVIIPYVPSPYCVAYDHNQERLIVGSENSKCVYVYRFI